ncbi:hypothetical protein K474DRAFT_1589213 [Panus rudis PR-1116 ss-1]|nr:hypothetical protein K474DRAFT_1589213 [Panus rudis PR-1116 ss-1]
MSQSYYPTQAYAPYQTSYSAYPNQTQYQAQYAAQTATPAFPPYAIGQPVKPPSPPPERPTAPEIPAVTSEVASHVLQRLISSELRRAGFEAAQPGAIQRLELDVVAFIEDLFRFAHDCANHANRSGPIATDALQAVRRHGFEPRDLRKVAAEWKKWKSGKLIVSFSEHNEPDAPEMLPPPPRSPSPELLESDDEDAPPVVPVTLRALPLNYLPALPPKHTYLRTPASPPKKAALPSLERKLKNASLVQESLKNLLLATEDSADQDGELLGAIVNWEATTHPRKRWRV